MDRQWFDNPRFRSLCQQNRIEAMINGNRKLVLLCPKYPGQEVEKQFKELIPEGQAWEIVMGLSTPIMATIKVILLMYGITDVGFKSLPGNKAIIEIFDVSKKNMATQPGSPLWRQVAAFLERDPFVQSYEIIVDNEVYLNSDGYAKADTPTISAEGEEFDEESMSSPRHVSSPLVGRVRGSSLKITDDRFDYNRSYLPKDAATDIRILLESTKTVDDFLKNI